MGGAFLPISNLFSQLLLSRGHSSTYMWCTIALSLLQLLTAFITYSYGIETMLSAFIMVNTGWIFVWLHFVHREIGLTSISFLKDICPYLLLSVILVFLAHYATIGIESIEIRLTSKIIGVGGLYILILWLMKSVILQESIAFFLKKKR